uniref:Spermidine synthase n=1 Tax=Steinernema glaseri TaxID=37863 RepID=A0A1I7YZC2_9BILA
MNNLSGKAPILKEGVEELGRRCSKMVNDCYIVKQMVGKDRTVLRYLDSQNFSQNGEYIISLLPMKMDRSGRVSFDRKTIQSEYIAAMVTFPYMVNALTIGESAKVLSIGLGAGSLDMFYHANRPELDITVVEKDEVMATVARTWFGVVEDEKRRTVIEAPVRGSFNGTLKTVLYHPIPTLRNLNLGDGIEYLQEAIGSRELFNVIALDACDGHSVNYRCPGASFYTAEVMKNVFAALTNEGAFVLNVITTNISAIETAVKQQFPSCFLGQLRATNRVIGCVKYAVEQTEKTANVFHVKFGVAMAKLGLEDVIGEDVFNPF